MTDIIGHHYNQNILKKAFLTDRIPHTWLFTGPKGIGKTSFAENFINIQLHQDNIYHLSTYPNFFHLKSENEPIRIDAIRQLIDSLNLTSFNAQYRFCLIDAIDDLNINASNALLKILEDPPEKTIFFLISHRPYTILKTIKSRCIQLRFHYLSYATTKNIIKLQAPSILPYYDFLYSLLKGVPGQFLTLDKYKGLDLFQNLENLLNKNDFDLLNFSLLIQKLIATPQIYDIFKTIFIGLQIQKTKKILSNHLNITQQEYKKIDLLSEFQVKLEKSKILHLEEILPFIETYSSFASR